MREPLHLECCSKIACIQNYRKHCKIRMKNGKLQIIASDFSVIVQN